MHETLARSEDPLLAEFAAVIDRRRETKMRIGTAVLRNEARAVETEIKFAGYLDQQRKSIDKLKAAEAVADSRVDRVRLDQRAIAGDAGDAGASAAEHDRPGEPDSRSDAGGAEPGACVDPGARSETAGELAIRHFDKVVRIAGDTTTADFVARRREQGPFRPLGTSLNKNGFSHGPFSLSCRDVDRPTPRR